MEKFKKFEIQKKDIVFGGSVGGGYKDTKWYGLNESGTDLYNLDTGNVIYL